MYETSQARGQEQRREMRATSTQMTNKWLIETQSTRQKELICFFIHIEVKARRRRKRLKVVEDGE